MYLQWVNIKHWSLAFLDPNPTSVAPNFLMVSAFPVLLCRILDPIYFGTYPEVLHTRLGDRLPKFSESEVRSLRGSVDFLGINHYTTHYGADITNASIPLPENLIDAGAASLSMHLHLIPTFGPVEDFAFNITNFQRVVYYMIITSKVDLVCIM